MSEPKHQETKEGARKAPSAPPQKKHRPWRKAAAVNRLRRNPERQER